MIIPDAKLSRMMCGEERFNTLRKSETEVPLPEATKRRNAETRTGWAARMRPGVVVIWEWRRSMRRVSGLFSLSIKRRVDDRDLYGALVLLQ